jgi:membrane protease YdiL (CAAX protease family)
MRMLSSSTSISPSMIHVGVLFLCGTINITRIRKRVSLPTCIVFDVIFALIIQYYILPFPSIVPWWGPITSVVSQKWYRCLTTFEKDTTNMTTLSSSSFKNWSSWIKGQIFDGGPLGQGLSKVVEVVVAISLWKLVHGHWPSMRLGPIPNIRSWSILIVICIIVNVVLYLWSYHTQSHGRHVGVNNMVSTTKNRSLTITEHIQFAVLAVLNGTCEEVTSRWFWWNEFEVYYPQQPNILQAVLFGVWHYHGIPSGWTGVGLTFINGAVMGLLKEYGNDGGLLLPICGHAIADYYLFATIARGKATTKTKKP